MPKVLYYERLNAPIWAWVAVELVIATLAIAYGSALGWLVGLGCFVALGAAAAWALIATAPVLEVTTEHLRAGRANIDWRYVGLVATLDPDSTRAARGAEADPRAFALMRPLSARGAVTIEICDDSDPHPYWLLSSTDPAALGSAIARAAHALPTEPVRQ